MSRHPPYRCGEKPPGKKILASWKQCTAQDNIRPQVHKTHSRLMPCLTRGKAFSARANDRRGKILRKAVKIDISSTESTNLSDKDKTNNVLTLREEIDEWRRKEASSRSDINDIDGEKETEAESTNSNKMKGHTYAASSLTELSQEYKENTSKTRVLLSSHNLEKYK